VRDICIIRCSIMFDGDVNGTLGSAIHIGWQRYRQLPHYCICGLLSLVIECR
jgi:hypothetical protein